MARKRMFDLEIINQESFLDLPMEAKALYFLLGMEADDEGFVSPKKVLRLYGGTEDSLKILILKKYIIPFSTGVVVITDWKRNNYLDKNKTKETIYLDEKALLTFNSKTEKYEFSQSLTEVKPKLNESLTSIEENRIDKNSIDNISCKYDMTLLEKNNENTLYENEFEDLWKYYPNKKGKKDAYKHYLTLRKKSKIEPKQVYEGIQRYLEFIRIEKVEPKYIKNGSTWFNQECWNDDYSIKNGKLTTSDLEITEDMIDDFFNF